MLAAIKNSLVLRIGWGIFALFLLNISIDVPDNYLQNVREDLSFNDQESILELVVEKILGFEDAFAEYDDTDTEDQEKKSVFKIDLYSPHVVVNYYGILPISLKKGFLSKKEKLLTGFYLHEGPPPEGLLV